MSTQPDQRDAFAAWTVEAREVDQLLMCDVAGRTRSWLAVEAVGDAGADRTRLWFGSAVVARAGETERSFVWRQLLRFHRLYSVALLGAARARVPRLATPP